MVRRCKTLLLLALPAALVAGTSFGQEKSQPDLREVTRLVLALVNEFRGQEGRGQVEIDVRLTEAAGYFAGYIARTGQFSHTADGSDPAGRARQHGYDYCIVSENIAYKYSSTGFTARALAQGFVEGWKNSPGHRRNMLDPDVTQTGAAVAGGSKQGHYYAAQMFGRPASQSVKFSIANQSNAAIRYQLGGKAFPLAPRQSRTHTQCRSEELKFDWPGGQQDTTIRPGDGNRLTIVRAESAN